MPTSTITGFCSMFGLRSLRALDLRAPYEQYGGPGVGTSASRTKRDELLLLEVYLPRTIRRFPHEGGTTRRTTAKHVAAGGLCNAVDHVPATPGRGCGHDVALGEVVDEERVAADLEKVTTELASPELLGLRVATLRDPRVAWEICGAGRCLGAARLPMSHSIEYAVLRGSHTEPPSQRR